MTLHHTVQKEFTSMSTSFPKGHPPPVSAWHVATQSRGRRRHPKRKYDETTTKSIGTAFGMTEDERAGGKESD